MKTKFDELGIDVPMELQDVGGVPTSAAEAPSAAEPGSGAALVGACGKFKTLTAPAGTSVQVCTEGGGSDAIVLQSKSSPEEACKSAKAWATGAGYAIEFDTNAMGSWAITLTGSGERMAIACTAATGQTSVSISLSPA
jgi:hypothetical protein